jgi:outer membrane murein-binding lipoprotein Lpp
MTSDAVHRFLTKWVVPAASTVVLAGALFASVQYIIKSEVADLKSDVSNLHSDIGSLTVNIATQHNDIGSTNARIDNILRDALERAFPKPTAGKAEITGSLKRADDALRFAKSQNIDLGAQLVSAYGKQLTSLSGDRQAWKTLANVLGYRSFLNSKFLPVLPPLRPYTYEEGGYEIHNSIVLEGDVSKAATTFPAVALAGYATPEQSARSEHLYHLQPNGSGAQFIIIDWKGKNIRIGLDDQYFKNVILKNASIVYLGGAIRLENVYFVNCTFDIVAPNPRTPGYDFALKALDNLAVTFTRS